MIEPAPPSSTSALVGTGQLVRLALRRDRTMLPVWITVFVLMAASSALAVEGLYPTVADRVRAADAINSTGSLVALYGRIYDPTSLGAIALIKLTGLGAALVGVLATNVVIRHTRAEEESGRLELLGALVLSGLDGPGSVAFGLMWASTGIAFGGAAAAAAQLTTAARSAIGLMSAGLVAAYLIRAVGDSGAERGWLSWFSPIGWSQQIRPYAGNRWTVSAGLLAGGVVLTVTAFALVDRRDLGAGLLPDRPGPARASRWLGSLLGLAWRLQRGVLAAWVTAFAVGGATLGAIASDVGNLLDSPTMREAVEALGGEKVLSDAFLAAEMGLLGTIASAWVIQSIHRLQSEEAALHAELLLAGAVSRVRWAMSHFVVAAGGAVAMLIAAGLAAGTAHGLATGDVGQVGRVLGGALVQMPAVAVFAGLAVLGVGIVPRSTVFGWSALVAALMVGEFGPVFDLDQRIVDLAPFGHVPRLPGSEIAWLPLGVMVAVGGAFTVVGLIGLRRRDIG